MKKILFGFILGLFALQVNAASLTLNNDGDSGFLNSPAPGAPSTHSLILGAGSWLVDFSMIDNPANSTAGMGFTVVETGLSSSGVGGPQDVVMGGGSYTINFLGSSPANTTVGLQVGIETAPSEIPVPAAVWLFGSALMGLVGVSRRKTASVAA